MPQAALPARGTCVVTEHTPHPVGNAAHSGRFTAVAAAVLAQQSTNEERPARAHGCSHTTPRPPAEGQQTVADAEQEGEPRRHLSQRRAAPPAHGCLSSQRPHREQKGRSSQRPTFFPKSFKDTRSLKGLCTRHQYRRTGTGGSTVPRTRGLY